MRQMFLTISLMLKVKGPAAGLAPEAEERSYYLPWIEKDLEPWRKHGITKVRQSHKSTTRWEQLLLMHGRCRFCL